MERAVLLHDRLRPACHACAACGAGEDIDHGAHPAGLILALTLTLNLTLTLTLAPTPTLTLTLTCTPTYAGAHPVGRRGRRRRGGSVGAGRGLRQEEQH